MSDVERIGAAMENLSDVESANPLTGIEPGETGHPKEYWPCPLCLMTLLEAYSCGTVYHLRAYEALQNSGLVGPWDGPEERVQTTERGRAFVEMLLATPLPVQKWTDPREDAKRVERS